MSVNIGNVTVTSSMSVKGVNETVTLAMSVNGGTVIETSSMSVKEVNEL
jgi:hypothetical protein